MKNPLRRMNYPLSCVQLLGVQFNAGRTPAEQKQKDEKAEREAKMNDALMRAL